MLTLATTAPTTDRLVLEQAIAKLREQRDAAIFGPWQHGGALDNDTAAGEVFFDGSVGAHVVATTDPDYGNADLIVTLHALIEPTLALLETELVSDRDGDGARPAIVAIARTIVDGPLL